MKLSPELAIAFAVALGLHGALVPWQDAAGSGGAGAQGENSVTVAAVSPQAAQLVETWTRPVEAKIQMSSPTAPTAPAQVSMVRANAESSLNRQVPSGMVEPDFAVNAPAIPATEASASFSWTPDTVTPELDVSFLRETPARRMALLQPVSPSAPADALPAIEPAPPVPDRAPRLVARPLPKPERPATPAVTRKLAAGSGLGTRKGTAKADTGSAVSATERQSAQATWATQIQQRIARHQSYPRGARGDGRVKVSMVIRANGQLGQVSVITSSGAARLDQAALLAVKKAAPFPPAPRVLEQPYFTVGQWIRFERR